jgi:hypothetical protein
VPRKGKPSKGESQERCRLKHGGEVSGGTRRQEGGNPEGAANRAGQVRGMSLPDSVSAVGTGTLERRARPKGLAHDDSVILRRGAKAPEGSAASFTWSRGGESRDVHRWGGNTRGPMGAQNPYGRNRLSRYPLAGTQPHGRTQERGDLLPAAGSFDVSGGATNRALWPS